MKNKKNAFLSNVWALKKCLPEEEMALKKALPEELLAMKKALPEVLLVIKYSYRKKIWSSNILTGRRCDQQIFLPEDLAINLITNIL